MSLRPPPVMGDPAQWSAATIRPARSDSEFLEAMLSQLLCDDPPARDNDVARPYVTPRVQSEGDA